MAFSITVATSLALFFRRIFAVLLMVKVEIKADTVYRGYNKRSVTFVYTYLGDQQTWRTVGPSFTTWRRCCSTRRNMFSF